MQQSRRTLLNFGIDVHISLKNPMTFLSLAALDGHCNLNDALYHHPYVRSYPPQCNRDLSTRPFFMSIDSDRWIIAVRKYGQCAPWSFFATMEHADMDLTSLEGTLMCSMVGQNDHGARIETFPGPTPTCSERLNSRQSITFTLEYPPCATAIPSHIGLAIQGNAQT